MVSDGEFADMQRRLQLLENRVGQWALNGLDSFDGLNALEFGPGTMRLSPTGIQIKRTSGSNEAGIVFVKDFNDSPLVTNPHVAVAGRYQSDFDGLYPTSLGIFSANVDDGSGKEYSAGVSITGTSEKGSNIQLGASDADGTDSGHVTLYPRRLVLEDVWLQMYSTTSDPTDAASYPLLGGSLFYRSDLGQVRLYNGSAWGSLSTLGGATAYPSAVYLLASSNSNVTNANDNTEKTYISVTIPARTIQGSDNVKHAIRITAGGTYLNNRGGTATLRLRIKFGGTTYWDDTTAALADSATETAWRLDCILTGNGDSAESLFGRFTLGGLGAATTGDGDLQTLDRVATTFAGAPAKDNTADQVFAFTAQNSNADANTKLVQTYYSIEVI